MVVRFMVIIKGLQSVLTLWNLLSIIMTMQ